MGKENIEAKMEYLKKYEEAVRQAERCRLRIEEIRLRRIIAPVVNDGMPHAKNKSDLSGYAAILEQEEKRYMKYRHNRAMKCKKITDRVERMEDEDEKDILIYRYIKLMKWYDICDKMGYSRQQVYRVHERALKNF